jgi:5-methyltetrahydrofolate--homocysteine methyltransferase
VSDLDSGSASGGILPSRLSRGEGRAVLSLDAVADRAEALRYYGVRPGAARAPDPRAVALLDAALAEVAALADPRGAYVVRRRDDFPALAALAAEQDGAGAPAEEAGGEPALVVLAVATIGPAPEARAARAQAAGELAYALALEAAGSAAVEAATDALEAAAARATGAHGLALGRRRSPGYGRFPLEFQHALLAEVGAAEIGIILTPGLLMVPRKSVSFAAPVVTRASSLALPAGQAACRSCGREACVFRSVAPHDPR